MKGTYEVAAIKALAVVELIDMTFRHFEIDHLADLSMVNDALRIGTLVGESFVSGREMNECSDENALLFLITRAMVRAGISLPLHHMTPSPSGLVH